MIIEYNLTTKQLFKANLLLAFYRTRKPYLLFIIFCFLYELIARGSLINFLIFMPIGLFIGYIVAFFLVLITVYRNKHFSGKRSLVVNVEGYQYSGDEFKREAKWSKKKKVWITKWYTILDTTSLFPVIIDNSALSENNISELKKIFESDKTEQENEL